MNGHERINTRPGGNVRVSIPVSVAANIDSFHKNIDLIAERLGCPTCFSGMDCSFQIERDFLVNEELQVTSTGQPAAISSIRNAAVGRDLTGRSVTATLAKDVSYDIGNLKEAVTRIADKLGCPACTSGFDLSFRHELEFLVDENVNVHALR